MEERPWLGDRTYLNMLVVLGNACRDIIYRARDLPQPGETVIATHAEYDLGGKGLNQAVTARRSGAEVRFIAPVGTDEVAQAIRKHLADEGIDADDMVVLEGRSDSSAIIVNASGENMIVSDTSCAEAMRPGSLMLHAGDALLLQGNLSREATADAIAAAKQAGAPVILNGAPFRFWMPPLAGGVDVLVVNEVEARQMGGHGPPIRIVTLGAGGCLVHAGGERRRISAPTVNVVDTTGAGDVFTGAFAASWISSHDVFGAAAFAIHAASDKVTRAGSLSAFPTTDTLNRLKTQLG